ncbi:monocarboxylate transporter 12-like [Acanthaster planci]|uniref:Monocarboxylate transporter 12-like n=1 Tax=Acanthaster planci TaxID=133434 RepID=A0A8B7Y8T3_ACAPL|nr:monocarboxylate transporter 12-like [Acanthaster planci]
MAKASHFFSRRRAADRPDHPREGGWGIVVVIAAHLSMAIQWGFQRTGSVLYLSWKEDFAINDKETAAVQSVSSSLSYLSGLISGVLTERLGCRVSGIIGGVLMSLGFLGSCWVTDIRQLYLTAAVVGIGTGISYNSSIVVVSEYFNRRYKIAHALVYAGVGTGSMVVPPLLQILLEGYGWRGTMMVASAIAANTVSFAAVFRPNKAPLRQKSSRQPDADQLELSVHVGMALTENPNEEITPDGSDTDSRSHPETPGELQAVQATHQARPSSQAGSIPLHSDRKHSNPAINVLRRLFVSLGLRLFARSYRFALTCVIQLQFMFAFTGFVLYLVPYAQSLDMAPTGAAFLLSILGIGSLLGCLGNGVLASRNMSTEHATMTSMVIAGVSVMLVNLNSYAIFAVASFLHGFASGFDFTVTVVLIRSFVGLSNLAIGVGFSMIFLGAGTLLGPVFAGWILDATGSSYLTVFYVLGAMFFFCAVQMLLLPLLKRVEPGVDISPADV